MIRSVEGLLGDQRGKHSVAMPVYTLANISQGRIHLPSPLSLEMRKAESVTVNVHASLLDTPDIQLMINRGILAVIEVIDSNKINNNIEVPVIRMVHEVASQAIADHEAEPDPHPQYAGGSGVELQRGLAFKSRLVDYTFTYDVDGNLVQVDYADLKVKTLTYSVDGVLQAVSYDGLTKNFTYDLDGNLTGVNFV